MGVPMRLYGSFAGKEAWTPPVSLPTTLRRNMEEDDTIRRAGGLTEGSLRRNVDQSDVIRRT